MYCIVPGCQSIGNPSWHKFPKDLALGEKWLKAIKCQRLLQMTYQEIRKKQYRVFSKHFVDESWIATFSKKRLKDDAVPTLELHVDSVMNIESFEKREEIPSLDVIDVEPNTLIINNALPFDLSPSLQYCKPLNPSPGGSVRRSSLNTPRTENMISSPTFDRLISIPIIPMSQIIINSPPLLNAPLSEKMPSSHTVDHLTSLPITPKGKVNEDSLSNQKFQSKKTRQGKRDLNHSDLTPKGKKAYVEILKLRKELWRCRKQLKRYLTKNTLLKYEIKFLKNKIHLI